MPADFLAQVVLCAAAVELQDDLAAAPRVGHARICSFPGHQALRADVVSGLLVQQQDDRTLGSAVELQMAGPMGRGAIQNGPEAGGEFQALHLAEAVLREFPSVADAPSLHC